MHILFVEPDRILADVYRRALVSQGHTVAIAPSAQSAIHSADVQRPDVVILELQLPVHNGIEFLYEFRSYSEWLHIPIIINSFVPPHEYMHASTLTRELGVTRFVHKPATSLQRLMQIVVAQTPLAHV